MKTRTNDIIMENKVFQWIAVGTGLILLIPLVSMLLGSEGWHWKLGDFVVMGILLFGTGSMFVLAARKVRKKVYRVAIGIAFAIALLLVWAELAVDAVSQLVNFLLG
jgi:ABC-type transport system involved in cytochrome c biogenesis permease component